jgi:hypothetical protein
MLAIPSAEPVTARSGSASRLSDDLHLPPERAAGMMVTRGVMPVNALSLLVALLTAAVSVAGLTLGGFNSTDPQAASSVTTSTAGIVLPNFRAHDAFNLAVAVPLLVATEWLARRGALAGRLLWPGALFYVLYTYTLYLVGAPFGPLFLAYVLLVILSAYTTVGSIASIDGRAVRARLAGAVPARTVGGILVGLAVMTLGQDAGGAVSTALAGGGPAEPLARHVWTADLVIEVPAMLIGGVLLWRRAALGYVAGAGLLVRFGLTPVALAAIIALQPWLTGSQSDGATVAGLLIFAGVAFAPLAFFLRPTASRQTTAALRPEGGARHG